MRRLADPQPGQRAGRALHGQADAADLDDGASGARAATRPATKAITPARLAAAATRAGGRCGPARRRARRGRSPAPSASAASAGVGASVSRRSRVTIAATWALSARPLPVTAAFISLGVCRATGMPAPAAADDGHRAGLGGAHHRAHVVLAEDPLDGDGVGPVLGEPGLDRRARWPAAGRRCRALGGVRTTSTATSVSGRPAEPSTTPSPHRVSPGSTPSTRTAYRLFSRWSVLVIAVRAVRTPVRTYLPAARHDRVPTRRALPAPVSPWLSALTTYTWSTPAARPRHEAQRPDAWCASST